jgi:AGZA family xanthine/uracil permease-like MFS transporter
MNGSVKTAMERFFDFPAHGATWRGEIVGGTTTFLTMAYIVFVQPAVLSGAMFGLSTGLDFGAVMTATCLSAALATMAMGLYARYPIALAPGMGENFVFVFSLLPAAAALPAVRSGVVQPWQTALGVILISGVLFVILSLTGARERILDVLSPNLKRAIAAGIGLFIAFIGLQNAGLIVKDPGTAVRLNPHVTSPDMLIFFAGLFISAALWARGVRGALLWGILAAVVLAWGLRLALEILPPLWRESPSVAESALMRHFQPARTLVSAPPSIAPTWLKADLATALSAPMIPFILLFLFMDVFDTLGTFVGVCAQGGFMKDNRILRADRVLTVDAVATVAGAAMGTSTVTSFIESAAGVAQGARTGVANLVTGLLFLLAPLAAPLVRMAGSYAPVTAPALVLVGAMMMRQAAAIAWEDPTEAVPAFLIILGIPLTYSIADGLALGFLAAAVVKALGGKARTIRPVEAIVALILLLYFVGIRARM